MAVAHWLHFLPVLTIHLTINIICHIPSVMTGLQILVLKTDGLHSILFQDHGSCSNEPFMGNLTNTISDLKIRAGWGQTGNQNIGGYRLGCIYHKNANKPRNGFPSVKYCQSICNLGKTGTDKPWFGFGILEEQDLTGS